MSVETSTSTRSNLLSAGQTASLHDDFFGAIPLQYTYLIKSDRSRYLYESSTGLWSDIDPSNTFILSQLTDKANTSYKIIDNFNRINSNLDPQHEQVSICDSRGNEHLLNLKIAHKGEAIHKKHSQLLENYQKVDFKTLLVDKGKFKGIFQEGNIAPDFKILLDELANYGGVEILVSKEIEHFNVSLAFEPPNDLIDQNIYIYILGDSDDTTFAETRLRILLDNYLDLFVDSVDIPLSLLPLVGGVSFGDFRAIAKETGVNIYLPSLLPELYHHSKKRNLNSVYLSGLEAQVLLAKKLMLDIIEKRKTNIIYKNISMLKYKKDSTLLSKKDDVSSVMYKHGVFIQLPPLGSKDTTVHFQGCSSDLIERAIVDFTNFSNEIIYANLWFHKDTIENNYHTPADLNVNVEELQDLVSRISIASNVTIYINVFNASFQIIGSQDDILKAVKLFSSYSKQLYLDCECAIDAKIELGLAYHEFISGKKNGKISKIMNNFKTSTINFEPLNDYSLLVDLKSVDFNDFINAYDQLQNEFPSEVRFYIPESFHRQIIGTGGSLIQSIMRKYNVFIKFSNSYDLKNNFKSHVRYDNVIVRCPFKNSSNIPLVKNELNNLLINNENTTFFNTFFKISRNQFRLFDFDKIQQIEKKTSTFVRFPNTEPNDFQLVEVLGTENHSANATKLFVNELAESYEFKISFSKKFNDTFTDLNKEFVEKIKVPFKILYNFEIMGLDRKTTSLVPYHSLILSFLPESDLFLEDAITHLTGFLRENEFMIIDRGELSNADTIVQGSASRYSQFSQNYNNVKSGNPFNKQHGSAGQVHANYDTNFSKYPFQPPSTTLPLQLPQSQQLYQLPNSQERIMVSQPTIVQPLGVNFSEQKILNAQNQAFEKRPATHNGYDNINVNSKPNFFQRRPF
ncbi:hypothetical protein BN7_4627 [Wickerhamomyces ciferrii]|uniref:K Homology domain-containing protein n=1 Tax=Wickerhamomyces ciferrii (strain ATCC 14091 / BCRC 22168 / CBS 111 / JCM 3599 / NBRC 0793 / NRRL Y-1031 F-60-10) TaxID=1206466 RepID=K0KUD7_WICCF|nr:uncharacterized protein BN7_4627 [Wickerhamomyces ciferrii]CCH45049.1 hypothetical protein BN7_4627 [Wickerhamomyces ciferrii]